MRAIVGDTHAERPHGRMLARQVRADVGVAYSLQIRKEMVFLERKMALDFRFHAGRQIGQQTRDIAVGLVRRTTAPTARQQLLKPLHQGDGRAMLVMQRLADPVGEAHHRSLMDVARLKSILAVSRATARI